MSFYLVAETSFVNNHLVAVGDIVQYDAPGTVGSNLLLLADGDPRIAAYLATNSTPSPPDATERGNAGNKVI